MHLALKAYDIGPGDEVITPSMTWVSTINLIVLAGATPVFADIDRDTLMVTRPNHKAMPYRPDSSNYSRALRRCRSGHGFDSSTGCR